MRASEHMTETSLYRGTDQLPGGDHGEPSATDAVERVIDAGQRLVTERIELAKLDVQDAVTEKVSQTTKVVVPALFAFGGWWILMAGVVVFLNAYLVLAASLGIVGGAHVLLGGAMAARALQRGRRGSHNGDAAHPANAARNGGSHPAGVNPTGVNPTGVNP
jgi:hypothetical protein